MTRAGNGARLVTSPSGHADPQQFLVALQEDFVLVDYGRFAKLIDISALERGRSFASLVGLSRYSRLRQALDGAKRTQNINSDLGLSALEAEVTTTARALGVVQRRIVAAHDEVTGAAGAEVAKLADLKTAVTSALAGIALLRPLLRTGSVMDLDFETAEKAVEKEEGGEVRKTLDTLTSTVASLSAIPVGAVDTNDIDRLIALSKKRDEAVRSVGADALHAFPFGECFASRPRLLTGPADEGECCVTDFSEGLRSRAGADPAGVLAECHVADVKQAVLDLPMVA